IALAVRVQGIPSLVPAQVPLEFRADVIELVEERDELVIEWLIKEARQAEGHQVKHLAVIDNVALHLVGDALAAADQLPIAEAQRSDTGLQTVGLGAAGLGHAEEQAANVDVLEPVATADHVSTEPAHVAAEIEGTIDRAGVEPGGRL